MQVCICMCMCIGVLRIQVEGMNLFIVPVVIQKELSLISSRSPTHPPNRSSYMNLYKLGSVLGSRGANILISYYYTRGLRQSADLISFWEMLFLSGLEVIGEQRTPTQGLYVASPSCGNNGLIYDLAFGPWVENYEHLRSAYFKYCHMPARCSIQRQTFS